MTSTNIIIRGRAGADAEGGVSASGRAWARVRVAVTERFRGADGIWVDGNTTWYTVSCFNELARNVQAGVKTGDPVIAAGSFTVEEWVRGTDGERFLTPTLRAVSMGHDMSLGLSNFARNPKPEQTRDSTANHAQTASDPEQRPDNVDLDGVVHDTGVGTQAATENGVTDGPSAPPAPPGFGSGVDPTDDSATDRYGSYSASSSVSAVSAA
ncbi:MAG: single-stranded DNA-binding protein [Galactobacter sp.]